MSAHRRLLLIALAALAVTVVAPFIGQTLPDEETTRRVILTLRLPRVGVAFAAGATLALCGMVFQALFRNDLASPYTLGVSSGASFGASVAILLGIGSVPLAALLGALISVTIVWRLSLLSHRFGAQTMLLAGVATGFFFSGLTVFVQYLADLSHSHRILHWLMGSLDVAALSELIKVTPALLVAVAASLFHRELDILTLGEEAAASRGVDPTRTALIQFVFTSLAVAGVVAVTGPIGFIGLMAPHIARLIVGPRHQILGPAAALIGGALLTLCDTLSRTLITPGEIPVGVLTALIGGPFFVWLIVRRKDH